MDQPPILTPTALPPVEKEPIPPRSRWRWLVHVLLLSAYVLGIGLIGSQIGDENPNERSALPTSVQGLLTACLTELAIFAVVFIVACLFTRPRARELFLNWTGGFKAVALAVVYSVLLRIAIAVVLMIVALPLVAYERVSKGEGADPKKVMEGFRPDVEAIISPEALEDPVYLGLTLTFVSFIVAGLREELWRAGMMAGLAGLAPSLFSSKRGQVAAVLVAAVIFGIGHLAQGLGAVFMTGVLGIGLGLIIVRHQSIWQATLAHGFFDATSFALLAALSKFAPDALKGF